MQNIGSSFGSVTFIDVDDEVYYLIKVNKNVSVGTDLDLLNVKNAIDIHNSLNGNADEGIVVKAVYWQKNVKIAYVKWTISPNYIDGGILGATIKILPDNSP